MMVYFEFLFLGMSLTLKDENLKITGIIEINYIMYINFCFLYIFLIIIFIGLSYNMINLTRIKIASEKKIIKLFGLR